MNIYNNYPLKEFNTFKINVSAKYFIELDNFKDFTDCMKLIQNEKFIFIGGGSNILFTRDFDGYVIKNSIKGIKIINETESDVYIQVESGENWHEFVAYCVENNYSGAENLASIPGTVGASVIQNIGAYGAEVQNIVHEVCAINLIDFTEQSFNNLECKFKYRDSIFKNDLKGKIFIKNVTFKLSKKFQSITEYQNSYGGVMDELKILNEEPNLRGIFNAVISLRTKKLADPKLFPNAGSFFKNPMVLIEKYQEIQSKFPDCPKYDTEDKNYVKLSAGWLIENIGYKGKIENGVGTYDKHALLLVNYTPEDKDSGIHLKEFAEKIEKEVNDKFGIVLEAEVNVV